MATTPQASASGSRQRSWLVRAARSFGGLREHARSLTVLLVGVGVSVGSFTFLLVQGRARERAAFNADVAPIVANLRSAFELPLEVLASTANLFEASREVTRAEFARFVKPALERHPGIRALEWIPLVPEAERSRYEEAARATVWSAFSFGSAARTERWRRLERATSTCPSISWSPGIPW